LEKNDGFGTEFNAPGTWFAVGTLSNTFTSLIEGATYKFRISASNLVYSTNPFPGDILQYSDSLSVICANVR
jgi:hypothetical protein